jgi:hypothetical protein
MMEYIDSVLAAVGIRHLHVATAQLSGRVSQQVLLVLQASNQIIHTFTPNKHSHPQ